MKSEIQAINLHIVFELGDKFSQIDISSDDLMGNELGEITRISCAWFEDFDKNSLEILKTDQGSKSIAREIAVSTGWSNEPMLVLHLGKTNIPIETRTQEIVGYLDNLLINSLLWNVDLSYKIYFLKLDDNMSDSCNIIDTIASKTNSVLVGEIVGEENSRLKESVNKNIGMRELYKCVKEKILSIGFSEYNEAMVEYQASKIIGDLEERGFFVDTKNEASISSISRIIANNIITG